MDRVEVGRYADPAEVGCLGWVATPNWIVFEHADGKLSVFNGLDEKGGVVGAAQVVPRADGTGVETPEPKPPAP